MKLQLFKFIFFLFLLATGYWLLATYSKAQDCGSDLQCQIDEIGREIAARLPAQEKNKQDLANLRKQLTDISSRITAISGRLKKNEADIAQREEDLEFAKKIFEQKANSHYKFIRLYDPLSPFLFASDAIQAFREINFRQKAADEDRKTMEKYAADLLKLKNDKETLEKNKASLASVQKQVDEKAKFLQGEVNKVEAYLSSLTAKQNELIALKEGGFQTSVGDVPPTLEPCTGPPGSSNFCNPVFSPAFAAFSFGAPHRKGMSQFGAYGRARAGQGAEDILHAYYGGIEIKKDYSTSESINVCGYGGSVDIETYTKRIYEMPMSWTDNGSAALKAQAVAARSYALAYKNSDTYKRVGCICADEGCQVYKPANKGGAWDAAVDATRGWVMVAGGQPFSAWYASTAGGYTLSYTANGYSTPGEWDADGGKGGWPNNAWDKKGGSPWFYKGWFRSRSGASCGRGNPWLTGEEMADILNAWKVLYQGGGDVSRISPVGSCWSGNPYSISELQNLGGYTGVSDVSVVYGNDGSTLSVRFAVNGNSSVTIPGDQFKKAFNLRAPGYIGLKSSLFNIEKL